MRREITRLQGPEQDMFDARFLQLLMKTFSGLEGLLFVLLVALLDQLPINPFHRHL